MGLGNLRAYSLSCPSSHSLTLLRGTLESSLPPEPTTMALSCQTSSLWNYERKKNLFLAGATQSEAFCHARLKVRFCSHKFRSIESYSKLPKDQKEPKKNIK